jgi:hypothetical protein
MRGIALLTTLAMSATAVYAQPARVDDDVRAPWRDRNHDNDPNGQWSYDRYDRYDRYNPNAQWTRDRYDRYSDSHWARDFRGRWMALGRAYSAQPQHQFVLGRERLSKLRIEGVRGEPVIQSITVEFGDGSTQAVDLGMRLPRGTGEVIDLNGGVRRIHRVIVYTDTRSRGAYALYGV